MPWEGRSAEALRSHPVVVSVRVGSELTRLILAIHLLAGRLVDRAANLHEAGLLLVERFFDLLDELLLGIIVQVRACRGHQRDVGDDGGLAGGELLEGEVSDHQWVVAKVEGTLLRNRLELLASPLLLDVERLGQLVDVLELEDFGCHLAVRLLHGLQIEEHLLGLLDHVLEAAGNRLADDGALGAAHRVADDAGLAGSRRQHPVIANLEGRLVLERLEDVLDAGQAALPPIGDVDGRLLAVEGVVLVLVEPHLGGDASHRARKVALDTVVAVRAFSGTERHAAARTALVSLLAGLDDVRQEVLLVRADLRQLLLVELTSLLAVCVFVDGEELVGV